MLTFFIRRLFQSLVAIFIAAFVLHALVLVVLPNRLDQRIQLRITQEMTGQKDEQVQRPAWPMLFFAWLFDPSQTTQINRDFVEVQKGIDLRIGDLRIRGSGALTGDFGNSLVVAPGLSATEVVGSRVGNSALLVLAALIPTLLISVPLGVVAASRAKTPIDHTLTLGSFVGLSMPPYWIGLMLILLFAVLAKSLHDGGWGWLPYLPPGNVAAAGDENLWTSRLYHLILPAATLAISQIAAISRHVRFAMLEVLHKDYVRTAWAKGLPPRKVFFRHAFRNALIPVITTITLALPVLVSGTVVVETVFGYAGLGLLFFKSMGGRVGSSIQFAGVSDFNVTMMLMMIMVIVVVLSNLLADILYVALNPRIRTREM